MAQFVTKDGRNLSQEEWRKIPEFPMYRVTADGDVRKIETGRLLVEQENAHGSYFYRVSKLMPNGAIKWFSRHYTRLVWDAFPELKPAPKAKSDKPTRSYIKRTYKWRTVPGYPKIEAHQEGAIRYTAGRRRMKPKFDVLDRPYFTLRNSEGDKRFSMNAILSLTFPELEFEEVVEEVDTGWKPIPRYEMYEVNREGQVRHKVRKMLLTRHSNGMYRLNTGGLKPWWCEGEIGNEEDWATFWNGTHPAQEEEAA